MLYAPQPAAAATLQVPEAFPTIQGAVNAALPGDLIDVAPGAYAGVVLDKAVTLRARVYDAADPRNNTTVIDGGTNSAIAVPSGVTPAPTVVGFNLRSRGADTVSLRSPAIIEDNHVTPGGGDLLAFEGGAGGIARGNVIEGAGDDGIDVDHLTKNLLLESNSIGLSGNDGIEIRLQDDTIAQTAVLTIRGNEIFGSREDAVQLIDYSTLTNRRFVIERNLLRNNTKAAIGLLDNQDSTEDFRAASILERIHVFHNTIVDNNHGISGGDNLVAVNNIFKGHLLALKGVDGNSVAANNLFFSNATNYQTSNVDLAGTIFADPLLDAAYELSPGSPAIDAGTATFSFQGEQVLSLAPAEYNGAAPDLGWHESTPSGPPPPTLFIGDVTGLEGNPPVTGTTFSFPVTVENPPTEGSITVGYATLDASARADTDFTAASGTLTFTFPGSATQNVDVVVSADTDSEPAEAFLVRLANATDATIADDTGVGTITNDDAPPPTVSVGDVTAPEGNPPATATMFSFPVTVTDPPAIGTLNVNYATEGDTATPDTDFTAAGGTLTFTFPGPTTLVADVSITPDTAPETDETFQLVLTGASGVPGATIADNSGQGTIANDDAQPTPTVVEVRVGAGRDDAEESTSGGVNLTSSDLELVFDGSNQTVGMRFAALAVPRNALVTSAYVQFTVDETSSDVASLTLEGEASDNAAAFTTATRNVSSRARTGPAVAWTPVAWTSVGQASANQRTPDLKAVVQQIVDRPGWVSGNALVVIVTGSGRRVGESFDGAAASAPLLHVEYLPPGPQQNQAPVVSAGPDQTVVLASGASLDGTVTDDGLPGPIVSTLWSQVSGPDGATALFANAAAVNTTVSFNLAGVYVLRLDASDGELWSSDEVMVTVTPLAPTVVEVRVATGNDDAEENAAGAVNLTSSDLELVFDKSTQTVGLRFGSVAVPRGAEVTAAWLQFTVDETGSASTALTLAGEASDNALPFAKTTRNVSARPRTSSSVAVSWSPQPWTVVGQAGPDQRTPGLAAVVQEIVGRPGWASGNAVVIVLTGSGKRTAVAYNGRASTAPLLHIEYVAP